MSSTTEGSTPVPNTTGFPTFFIVVDGEIADIWVINPNMERKVAAMSSDPKIYVMPGGFPADGVLPQIGSAWSPPAIEQT